MIKTKTIGILGAALVGAIGVTVLVLQNREKAVQSAETRTTLFPGFAAAMKDAAKIQVQKKDASFTLERKGAKWGLADANGYPIDPEPVRKLLFALSEMETVEAKTQTKELYSQLGVEDHDAEGAKSTLVTVTDTGGKELARLVVGKNYEPKQYSPKQQSYVRKAGEAQSWLVKGQLDLKEKGTDWLEREILKVTRERIASVEVKHPDGQVVRVSKAAPELTDYTLENIPEGKELKYATIASTLVGGLEYVNLEDVEPVGATDFAQEPGPVSTFTCFDGLVVTVRCKEKDGKTYARFEAAFVEPAAAPAGPEPEAPAEGQPPKPAKKTPDEVKKEVEELSQKLSAWTYVISSYNRTAYFKRMEDLVQDKKPPTPPEGANPDETFKIPGDLPPEIQEQIKKDLESKGHKSEVVPAPVNGGGEAPKPVDGASPTEGAPVTKPVDTTPGGGGG